MNVFENIVSRDIDELAEWFDKHWETDNAPWDVWFDKNYCQKCESITKSIPGDYMEHEFCYCELYRKCRFFQDMDETLSNKQVIMMWLESEC